jgi:pyruvate formate-lyase activating enzyme-like uncharacterized protein
LGDIIYDTPIPIKFISQTNSNFFIFSVHPDSGTIDNFIFDNNYAPNINRDHLQERIANFLYQRDFLLDYYASPDTGTHILKGFFQWFYSPYKVIMYICDQNFKDFVLTNDNVQEFDGNFHNPKEHFTGDGVGVFASALADTLVYRIVKK